MPPVPVNADVVRMTQVVLNLLDNACKFTPTGGTLVLAVDQDADYARILVRDSGSGIAAEELPRLVQMFYQTPHAVAPSHGGLGIGLALVSRIVEMHGGSVDATSDGPGSGSEFVVRLPLVELPRVPAPAAPAHPNSVAVSSTRRRILVVDDNEDNAESLALVLRRLGNEVLTAYDGKAAVEKAQSFSPDVVLLDIGLPILDGLEVARRVRERHGTLRPVLVAITGLGRPEDLRRSAEAGFDHHLVKPIDLPSLEGLLARER